MKFPFESSFFQSMKCLGNFSLVRVIPQLYPENREPFHAHFPQILELLQNDQTDQSERLSILQFTSMVANANPDVSC